MDLDHLRYFREVAKTENITQAAKSLFMTQPALSTVIKRLEAELGFACFARKGNRIELTEAGRCFLSYVNSTFSILDEGIKKATALADQHNSVVHLASSFGVVSAMTRAYKEQDQNTKIKLDLHPTEEVIRAVANGDADIGVILGGVSDIRLQEHTLIDSRYYICVDKEHPFASRDTVRMAELEGMLLFCSNIAVTSDTVRRITEKANVACNILTLDEGEVLFAAVKKGLGAMLCVPMINENHTTQIDDGLAFVPIADCSERAPVTMVFTKDAYFTEEQARYIRYIEQCFASDAELLKKDLRARGVE